MRNVRKSNGHSRAEFVGFGEYISIKKSIADYTHCDVSHVLVDIDNALIMPGLLNLFAVVPHNIGITYNMAWLERWGHDLALMTVKITFATEDAIADYGTKGIMNCQAFIKVIGMLDQDAMDMLWFIEQDGGEWSEMQTTNIAFTRQMS